MTEDEKKQDDFNDKFDRENGLALIREPFAANQIGALPKPTKRQAEMVKNDFKKGIRCKVCGGWHHPDVVHLDFVGHAALTDRLLDCDISWNWEPVATDENGAPRMDNVGGMWIKLTVCGLTRLGYGHPDGKTGGDAIKETIGDALRNAAMRFGAALDLWHKGDLHVDDDESAASNGEAAPARQAYLRLAQEIPKLVSVEACDVTVLAKAYADDWELLPDAGRKELVKRINYRRDEILSDSDQAKPLVDDEIPY